LQLTAAVNVESETDKLFSVFVLTCSLPFWVIDVI